jgi:hypothetical protein
LANTPANTPAEAFDPEAARHFFKPAESPALESARRSNAAKLFLSFARFPFATQEETSHAYRIEIHDLRFAAGAATVNPASTASTALGEVVAIITVDAQSQGIPVIISDDLRFAATPERPRSRAVVRQTSGAR